jgi:hypothetical protein
MDNAMLQYCIQTTLISARLKANYSYLQRHKALDSKATAGNRLQHLRPEQPVGVFPGRVLAHLCDLLLRHCRQDVFPGRIEFAFASTWATSSSFMLAALTLAPCFEQRAVPRRSCQANELELDREFDSCQDWAPACA